MPTTGRLGSGPWAVSALDFPASEPPAQPWLFRVSGDSVELRADRRQALPVVDPSDRELTISCGAALLALRAGLRRFGYRGDAYEVLPDPGDPDLLARVHLVASEAASPAEVALFEAIVRRRTTRAAYDPRPVAAAVQHELEQGVAGCSYLNQPVEAAELRPRLAAAIGRDAEHPQLVMGFGTGPKTRPSPRRPVEDVLLAPAS